MNSYMVGLIDDKLRVKQEDIVDDRFQTLPKQATIVEDPVSHRRSRDKHRSAPNRSRSSGDFPLSMEIQELTGDVAKQNDEGQPSSGERRRRGQSRSRKSSSQRGRRGKEQTNGRSHSRSRSRSKSKSRRVSNRGRSKPSDETPGSSSTLNPPCTPSKSRRSSRNLARDEAGIGCGQPVTPSTSRRSTRGLLLSSNKDDIKTPSTSRRTMRGKDNKQRSRSKSHDRNRRSSRKSRGKSVERTPSSRSGESRIPRGIRGKNTDSKSRRSNAAMGTTSHSADSLNGRPVSSMQNFPTYSLHDDSVMSPSLSKGRLPRSVSNHMSSRGLRECFKNKCFSPKHGKYRTFDRGVFEYGRHFDREFFR